MRASEIEKKMLIGLKVFNKELLVALPNKQ